MASKTFLDKIPELLAGAREGVSSLTGKTLDFTPASLEHVEAGLASLYERLVGLAEHKSADQARAGAGMMFGAYLGEVFRRRFGGEWVLSVAKHEELGPAVSLAGEPYFPVQAVLLRIMLGADYNVVKRFAEWARSVDATPLDHGTDRETVANQMFRFAREAAVEIETRMRTRLDFTAASLPRFDAALERMRTATERSGAPVTIEPIAKLKLGAYLGEVLRRELGGVWTTLSEGAVLQNLPVVSFGERRAIPHGVLAQLLTGRGTEVDGVELHRTASYFDAVAKWRRDSVEQDVIGSPEGGGGELDTLRSAMSDDAELAQELLGWLATASVTAATKWNVKLDYSESSLERVEEILDVLHRASKEPDAPGDPKPSAEQVDRMALVWGVYVGEMLRRTYGGKWTKTPLEKHGEVLRIELGPRMVFPVAKVRKRILEGPADSVLFYYRALGKMLLEGKPPEEVPGATFVDPRPVLEWRKPSAALLDFVDAAFELAFQFGEKSAERLVPFLMFLEDGKRSVESYAMIRAGTRIEAGRRSAARRLPLCDAVALVYDGYVAMGPDKVPAFLAEAEEKGVSSGFIFAQRYENRDGTRRAEGSPFAIQEYSFAKTSPPAAMEEGPEEPPPLNPPSPEPPPLDPPALEPPPLDAPRQEVRTERQVVTELLTPDGQKLDSLTRFPTGAVLEFYVLEGGTVVRTTRRLVPGSLLAAKNVSLAGTALSSAALTEARDAVLRGFRFADPDKTGCGESVCAVSAEALSEPPDPLRLAPLLEAIGSLPDAFYRNRGAVMVRENRGSER